MSETRKVLAGSLGTLLIVVMGLFLMCAVQHGAVKNEPATDDEAYKKELIELLGLQEEVPPPETEQSKAQTADTTVAETTVSEVVSLPDTVSVGDRPEELAALLEKIDSLNRVVSEREREIKRLTEEAQKLDQSITRVKQQLLVAKGEAPLTPVQLRVGAGQQVSLAKFEARYKEALKLFNQRKYAQARQIFESLLLQNPKHRLADNCQYWIGECYFGERRYLEALAEFEKVFSFDAQDKYDDAQIMIALCHLRLGNPAQAKLELEQFLRFYPKSEYVAKAEAMYRRVSAQV
ncbi:MAG: tetratricopeptide repeat protein [Calditrichaeota bacterium]|nr:tetratricopeptide repeat protein [Calditrichota bacterium]